MRDEEPTDEIEKTQKAKDETHQTLLAARTCHPIGHILHLSSHQRDIQHTLLQTHERKQSCDGEEEDLENLSRRVEIHNFRIHFTHAFISSTVDCSPNCNMFPLEFTHQTVEFSDCHISGRLQVNVHGHLRKLFKKFLKEEDFIPLRFDNTASPEGFVLFGHGGKLIRPEFIDQFIHSARPLQIGVVVDDQLPILGDADVQFEHVTHPIGGLEDLEGVFWTLEGSPTVTNTEKRGGFDELVEDVVVVTHPAVEDVGQAEEEGGECQIASRDDQPQPLQIHYYRVHPKSTQINTLPDQKSQNVLYLYMHRS